MQLNQTYEGYEYVLTSVHKLEKKKVEFSASNIRDDCLIARTNYSAISPGTELAAWAGQRPLHANGKKFPRLLGYCNVAEVIATGNAVRDIKIGDKILTHKHHCSVFVASQTDVLLKLDRDIDCSEITKLYLYHLGYSAVIKANESPGIRAYIIGGGVLGTTSAYMSSIAGWDTYQVTNSVQDENQGEFRKISRAGSDEHSDKANVVISTSNSWSDWQLALRLASRNGKIVVLGFPGREEECEINPLISDYFYNKQLTICASGICPEDSESGQILYNQKDNMARLLNWVTAKKIDLSKLSSVRVPAGELAEVYNELDSNQRKSHTVILDWNYE